MENEELKEAEKQSSGVAEISPSAPTYAKATVDKQATGDAKKRKSTLMPYLLIILAIVIFGALAYGYWQYKSDSGLALFGHKYGGKTVTVTTTTTTTATTTGATATTGAVATATADWLTYTNTKYSYLFKYPNTVELTASAENSNDMAISATAGGVNVSPAGGNSGNGIFYVSVPNIAFTTTAIKNQFGSTKAENMAITSKTIAGASSYEVVISGDSTVVSTFYFIQSPSGTVLELTVLNNSSDAQNVLSSFQFDPTAGWKTYTNTTDGYSIKYPADWYVEYSNGQSYPGDKGESTKQLYISPSKIVECTDACAPGPYSQSLSIQGGSASAGQTLDSVFNSITSSWNGLEKTSLTIGGQTGYKGVDSCETDGGVGCGDPIWLVVHNGKSYEFNSNLSYQSTYDTIVSTFQFTN